MKWLFCRSAASAVTARMAAWPLAIFWVLAAVACSPALNWRSVTLGEHSVTLPCKPDRGQRTVPLGAYSVAMEMVGCEADGALFAVSLVRVPDGVDAGVLQAQWQAASLQQMRSQPGLQQPLAIAGAPNSAMRAISAQGQGADGRPVQARLAWLTTGGELVQLAVYAPRLTQELTEPFFAGVRLP